MDVELTPLQHALDWTGCAFGLTGAFMLAARLRISRYGWIAFFAANLVYIALAGHLGVLGFLAQQIGFLFSSAVGIYRSFISPSRGQVDQVAEDHGRQQAWSISARLAAIPLSHLSGAADDLARLIEEAKSLHPEMADAGSDRQRRGEPSALAD